MDSSFRNTLKQWSPVIVLLVAMISIQSGAAFAKQLLLTLGVPGTVTLRLSLAAIILCLICQPWKRFPSREAVQWIGLYGLTIAAMNTMIYAAFLYIPLGIAVALEFLGPLAVAILGSRKKLDFLWVFLAGLGVLLLLPKADMGNQLPWQGVLYALGAGVAWALYIVIGQRAGATAPSSMVTTIGILSGALAVTPIGLANTGLELFRPQYLPIGLAIAVMSSALPYYLEMVALKAMPTKTFGVLTSLEPALASLSGMIILHEFLSVIQWLAVICIILASFGAVATSRQPAATPELGV